MRTQNKFVLVSIQFQILVIIRILYKIVYIIPLISPQPINDLLRECMEVEFQ